MSSIDEIQKGLAEFLSRHWDEPVHIENLQTATTGARRQNLFFEAQRKAERVSLVATITPNRAMQVMDV
ncbi:MAG: hypothetical protein AAEJ52_22730, partial [Myxococcota bacterium]